MRRQVLKFWKKRPSKWHGVNFLDLIPETVVGHEVEEETGQIVLLMPRYRDPIMGRLIQPRLKGQKRFIRVPLEARGSVLWQKIDGKSPIRDLVPHYEQAFPDDATGSAERVCAYMAGLQGNSFVRFVNADEMTR